MCTMAATTGGRSQLLLGNMMHCQQTHFLDFGSVKDAICTWLLPDPNCDLARPAQPCVKTIGMRAPLRCTPTSPLHHHLTSIGLCRLKTNRSKHPHKHQSHATS
jgi:hypothetical protein